MNERANQIPQPSPTPPAPTPAGSNPAASNPAAPNKAASNPAASSQPAQGPGEEKTSFYNAIGGEPTFRRLVDEFYAGVADDPVLRPLYPEADLGPANDRLRMFLEQYWGGPGTYSEQRGHPRLRQRHAPFRVGPTERDAWLRQMRHALESLHLDPSHEATLWEYLERAAMFMVNTLDE